MKTVVVLMGLPSSGKTTYAGKIYKDSPEWVVVDGDQLLGKVLKSIKELVPTYKSVVVDGTHLTKESRRKIIDTALESECSVECVWMITPLTVCLSRNANRKEEERISDSKIKKMEKEIEPPDNFEGFSRIRKVLELAPGET